MKEKEGLVDCPEQQVILYVEKDNGRFEPIQTGSYLTKNYLDDFFLKRCNLKKSLTEQIARGEISPIHYYMVLEDLTLTELAARVRISAKRVSKHLNSVFFATIKPSELERYAVTFNVSVQELVTPDPDMEQMKAEEINE